MAKPVLNLSTLNLGTDEIGGLPRFNITYSPVNPGDEAAVCTPPPATVVMVDLPDIPAIDQTCSFVFPQNQLIPPIYNPPVDVPPACEDFTSNIEIKTWRRAVKGSYFIVEPFTVPNCGLNIKGELVVNACETFNADVLLTTSKAMRKSRMTITKTGIPDCGFKLHTHLDIDACTSFAATSSVTFKGAARKSRLNVIPSRVPDCGFRLQGDIIVDACEEFKMNSSFTVTGGGATGELKVESTGAPNCGATITGYIDVPEIDFADYDLFSYYPDVMYGNCRKTYCVRIHLPAGFLGDSILTGAFDPAAIKEQTTWIFKPIPNTNGNCKRSGRSGGGGGGGSGDKYNQWMDCAYLELLVIPPDGFECDWTRTRKYWNTACTCSHSEVPIGYARLCYPSAEEAGCCNIYLRHKYKRIIAANLNKGAKVKIIANTNDIPGDEKVAMFRKVKFCSDEAGDQQAWVWMTEPEAWVD